MTSSNWPAPGRRGRRRRSHRRWLGVLLVVPALALLAAWLPGGMLFGASDSWRPATPEQRPDLDNAVAVGRESGLPLYPCRGLIQGGMQLGRLRGDFGGCHIGYGGREVEVASFEVLTSRWQRATGWDLPAGATPAGTLLDTSAVGGFTSTGLYVCRAVHEGGLHPGQAEARRKGCSFGFGGRIVVAQTYDMLENMPWTVWAAATPETVPEDAIVGGGEGGEPLLICRAADSTGLHPGKLRRSGKGCSIVSGGDELIVPRFEVLVPRWIASKASAMPVAAMPMGRENAALQFVCRARAGRDLQIGKASTSLEGCHVGMDGREVIVGSFEVLSQ
ncbi:MAG: DUF3421 domain-containing protein [Geminicoccaceae bacterium]